MMTRLMFGTRPDLFLWWLLAVVVALVVGFVLRLLCAPLLRWLEAEPDEAKVEGAPKPLGIVRRHGITVKVYAKRAGPR